MERFWHYYDVVRYKGYEGLCIVHNETMDGVISDINDIVKSAERSGYHNDEKWIIVSVECGTKLDEDGVFDSSWKKCVAVALYDNGKVTDL